MASGGEELMLSLMPSGPAPDPLVIATSLSHLHGSAGLPAGTWLPLVADAAAAAAYGVMGVVLLVLWRRWRADRPLRWGFMAVAGALLACGITQLLELWADDGAASDWVWTAKVATAVIAIGSAALLLRLRSLPAPQTLEGVVRDLRAANASLQASEETFRAFMDNGPLRCWICDGDGIYHYANKPNEDHMKVPGGLRGRRVQDIFPPDLAQQFIESDRAVLRAGTAPARPQSLRIGTDDFQIYKFPVRAADGRMMVAGIALDVTEQRAAHSALQEKTQLLTAVTEALRVYLDAGDWKTAHTLLLRNALRQTQSQFGLVGVMVDGPKLRILAQEGVQWEEHPAGPVAEAAQRDLREHGYVEFAQLDNLLGRVVAQGEVVIVNTPDPAAAGGGLPPGFPALQSYLGVPVRRAKRVVGMIAVANRPGGYDLSAQAQLEMLVQQAGVLCDNYRRSLREEVLEEQVRVSQKMEAIGLLAGGVAHDFNNLLQVIKGYTAMALETAMPWPDRRASLEHVRAAGDRAAQLTQQLLAFGRQQTLRKADLDLNQAIKDLLRMIRRVIGEQITVDFIPGHDLGNVHADRAQIDQVLLNLCINARDALPNGGRVTIETENVLVNGAFQESHPWAKPGRYVLVTVSDNGIGMDKETVARVFEPFFTTKPKDKGTGLGLAVVYGVVKQHDGLVHVYSEPGRGTTLKIYLPIIERAATSVGPKHGPAQPRGTETILLAEDEPMVRDLATRILRRAGYQVLVANDGAEAVAMFALHDSEISLLILDVVMPELGGREAYERISKQRPGLPVIFCSGYAGSALGVDSLASTGARLLAKPYGADEMLESVRAALDRR